MRERPDGADLLAIALGIAERQLRHGDAPAREEHKVLAALLRQDGTLPELNLAFARAIRAGEMDANPQARELLWEATLARVRESAPKALAAWGQG